ncbi:murein DD-endopeptidase MepM [Buchnera aphidicola (Brachycaudus cardui)]|uniref:Murein DD-endopeptidase MepM n=1 Tax=Buchnera aphidicola (Brachycaudus cardui) TaxID=557993 RepID=A0A4D6XX21_9GAMM|nr:peptidoglycan DD-metalloendopeptidase family protein [Buchnera aphidicola]QCI20457.1 murein DD-endopeptidase MepM [Buchnera aphidicola (Brachycaudus cardui)]
MQQIYKIFFLYFCRISFFYKIISILINSIIIFLLSGCSTLFPNQIKNSTIKSKYNIKEYLNEEVDNIKKYFHLIKKEDDISVLLSTSGVRLNDILKIKKIDFNLNNLQPGQKLFWTVNASGKLLKLTWKISAIQKNIYKSINNNFLISKKLSKNILIKKSILIKKKSNFFRSALELGLKKSEIQSVINALEWQVDFKNLNIGSNFNLVFLHNVLQNKNILLGVKLNNFKKKYYSIRAFNGKFYDIYGFNKEEYLINSSFLKKYRISSNFNLHRLNPVTHRVSRHLGVDLAMPQGTPILATINGIVIKARFNKIAGLYIALKNKNHYITKYMHLKTLLVKLGDNIKIGQKIALSGNTGRTTGPHLHYEVWINNHAINPIKLKSLFSNTLTKNEKKTYLEQSKKILKYLQ